MLVVATHLVKTEEGKANNGVKGGAYGLISLIPAAIGRDGSRRMLISQKPPRRPSLKKDEGENRSSVLMQ
jgi:hypothetical protein